MRVEGALWSHVVVCASKRASTAVRSTRVTSFLIPSGSDLWKSVTSEDGSEKWVYVCYIASSAKSSRKGMFDSELAKITFVQHDTLELSTGDMDSQN